MGRFEPRSLIPVGDFIYLQIIVELVLQEGEHSFISYSPLLYYVYKHKPGIIAWKGYGESAICLYSILCVDKGRDPL